MLKVCVGVVCALVGSAAADPYADSVVDFDLGAGGLGPGFDNPAWVLGEPTRFTAPGNQFGGPTTPFQAAFGADELFSIGEGGFVTVRFDEPVVNDPANPFGIDLLVFGNSFFFDQSFPDGVAGSLSSEGGLIEVSDNGTDWFAVPAVGGSGADGLFPTLGYLDVTEAFPSQAGSVLSDFTKPVDPSFDPTGLALADIIAGYDSSGGGAGVDIGAVGLASISYVRISNALGSGVTPEIDGFADVVPAPGSMGAVLVGGLLLSRRRRGGQGTRRG